MKMIMMKWLIDFFILVVSERFPYYTVEGGADNGSMIELVTIDELKGIIEKSNNYKI